MYTKAKKVQAWPMLLWIYCLTLLAGFFNAGAIIMYARPASHHTGNLSAWAIAIVDGQSSLIIELFGVMFAFLIGSLCAGLLFHDRMWRADKRYGVVLLAMGIILAVAVLFHNNRRVLLYLGSGFMGLQNGLFVFYRNILVRTTHMTGTMTDLCFAIGSFLRGKKSEGRKIVYYSLSIASFLLGGFIATQVMPAGTKIFWLVLSIGYFLAGLYYFYLRHHRCLMTKNIEVGNKESHNRDTG